MESNYIEPENVLTEEEYAEIDAFCTSRMKKKTLSDVAEFLKNRLDLDLVLDPDIVSGFVSDSSNLPGRAVGLFRPASVRECAILFRTCFSAGISYTVSAGKSNLTGSATPEGGVIVSTVNLMTPPVRVDVETATVAAPVGMILEDMRNDVLEQTDRIWQYPVDPTSRTDATVGGTIACNASGFVPGEKGATRSWVEQIEFLLPDGRLIRAPRGRYVSIGGKFILVRSGTTLEWPVPRYPRPPIKNAGGPYSAPDGVIDLVDLIVGSEGLFGLVVACRLKLTKRPSDHLDLFFSFPSEAGALKLFHFLHGKMNGSFGGLSAFEYFGVNCRQYMEHQEIFFPGENQVGVNIQVPLFDATIEDAAEKWLMLLEEADCGLSDENIILMDNDRVRSKFLAARHSMPAKAVEVVEHRGTYTIMTDTVVPPEKFDEFLASTHALIRAGGIDYLSFGHLGDCHLHFTLLPQKDQLEAGRAIYEEIVARCAALGGVYSGEHGTGKRKRQDFLKCHGVSAAEDVRRCKEAVDPHFLLNRGNVIEAG